METLPEDIDRDQSSTSTHDIEKENIATGEATHGTPKYHEDRAAVEQLDGGAVEKQITGKSANPSVNNIKAVPNGGLKAWLQVVGAFFLFFNSWVSLSHPSYFSSRRCTWTGS